jgi:biotin carboxyl carrier protein
MPLSFEEIADIVDIIEASELRELVVDFSGTRLTVRRGEADERLDPALNPLPSPPPLPAAPAPDAGARSGGAVEVRAPTLGTFRRAHAPEDPPLVAVGAVVKPGQAIGSIEVLRSRIPIEAPRAGRIADIAAESGALVEYDQLLFVIEPI